MSTAVIPYRFLFRLMYRCPYVSDMVKDDEDLLIDLPESARINPFREIDGLAQFAEVCLGWNETGLGLTVEVRGKENTPIGDPERPRQSDGVTLWIDTRGDRTGHRASRTCHQFHFLPTGGGSDQSEPLFAQTKIHRALQDAPLVGVEDVPFRSERTKKGYRIEAFLSANVLNGFDPEQNPRLGLFYVIRDFELGDQTLGLTSEFPYWEDPSLWATLELARSGS